MKRSYKKQSVEYRGKAVETPYQKAQQEWDNRIGHASVQAKNWRFVAVLSLLVAIILLVMLIVSLSMSQTKIFVAEVDHGGRVVNVLPLQERYQPNVAQEKYFISHFIHLIRDVPLDPVVAKKQWLDAYAFLTQRSAAILNHYFKQNDPTQLLGHQTVIVKITDINAISDHSYQVDWVENAVDNNGQRLGQKTYSGVFTIAIHQPTSVQAILKNPLGVFITDFHFSPRATQND